MFVSKRELTTQASCFINPILPTEFCHLVEGRCKVATVRSKADKSWLIHSPFRKCLWLRNIFPQTLLLPKTCWGELRFLHYWWEQKILRKHATWIKQMARLRPALSLGGYNGTDSPAESPCWHNKALAWGSFSGSTVSYSFPDIQGPFFFSISSGGLPRAQIQSSFAKTVIIKLPMPNPDPLLKQ